MCGKPSPPEPLRPEHDVEQFSSGVPVLDDWLRRRARKNEDAGASRTFVVTRGNRVVAYYCLAAGSLAHNQAPGAVRRNMPDPIPVIVLGRLAVDLTEQRSGLGSALLRDAMMRVVGVSHEVGIKAMLVHAISPQAAAFYAKQGFVQSLTSEMTLMLSIDTIRKSLMGDGPET